MDKVEFLDAIDKVSKFIVEYYDTVRTGNVMANVQPGYLAAITEKQCPSQGASFDDIFAEFHEKIMPGVVHWASPHFHAYFPAGNCFPSMIGELLIAGINNVGVTWESSPAMTELETVVLNWLGKMMDLPEEFLNCSEGPGGGVFQNTSTESTLLSLIAARNQAIRKHRRLQPELTVAQLNEKLILYTSIQSHASVERVALMTALTVRMLPCDRDGKVTRETLTAAIESDLDESLIPCFLVATMGATSTCSWDDLSELGPVCQAYDIWMHVDAAYAGAALTCPELRYISRGLHYASSFAVGLHKWFLVSFDTVAYWLKDTVALSDALFVDRLYLKHNHGKAMDFTHLQIGNGRRFKALKVWITLKSYGVKGVQQHIRRHVMLAQYMERLMKQDRRFRILTSGLGLVIFALRGGDERTRTLRQEIIDEGRLTLTPCQYHGWYVIRFVVNHSTQVEDVEYAWDVIRSTANRLEDVAAARKSEYADMLFSSVGTISSAVEI